MEKNYEAKYHLLEENNWWFVGRRNIILKQIKKYGIHQNSRILEIGCAGGPLLKALNEKGFTNLYGIDISEKAIKMCEEKGLDNTEVMDGAATHFQDQEFDLIIASDILEHINKDNDALAEWLRILNPQGTLILFVPAFQYLWSDHDIVNNHYRRYSKQQIKNCLDIAGFYTLKLSYWNFLLFFPTFLFRSLQKMRNKSNKESKDQLYSFNSILNNSLILILKLENLLLQHINLPVGVSLFAICKKPEGLVHKKEGESNF